MENQTYIIYPDTAKVVHEPGMEVVAKHFISEPGQVSFGVVDFVPGRAVKLHTHNTWEVIIIDGGSEGPGFVYFDDQWWRADPGSAVFVPRGFVHAWSAGNNNRFKMLWIYQGSLEEAGRDWVEDYRTSHLITTEEEKNALVWTPEAGRRAVEKVRNIT